MYTISTDKIILNIPFNMNFVNDLKSKTSSRKWDASRKIWVVDISERKTVEKLLSRHFNYTPASTGTQLLEITAKREMVEDKGPVSFQGFPICTASGRDSGARVCHNVTLLRGGKSALEVALKIGALWLKRVLHFR